MCKSLATDADQISAHYSVLPEKGVQLSRGARRMGRRSADCALQDCGRRLFAVAPAEGISF